LELVGERLHFKLVDGDGPQTGWVSTRLRERDLLIRIGNSQLGAPPSLFTENVQQKWGPPSGIEALGNSRSPQQPLGFSSQSLAARNPGAVVPWFAGWSWRNAVCRRCGDNIGFRYEGSDRIFWALDQKQPKERQSSELKAEGDLALTPTSDEGTAESTKAAPKQDGRVEDPQLPLDAARQSPEEHPQAAKENQSANILADTCLQAFSLALKEQLARGLVCKTPGFDQTLNSLKVDDATRALLHQELHIRPGINAVQVERLIVKAFRGKVNKLRSLGPRALRDVLSECVRSMEASMTSRDEGKSQDSRSGV